MYEAFGITDPGLVRKTNEDAFLCCDDLGLFAVADGMGGHSGGDVASHLALEAVETFIERSSADDDFSWPYGVDPQLSFDANRMRTALHLANRRVFRAAESRDDYTGMGTTLTALLLDDMTAVYGHVGDSRLYLLRGGKLTTLTRDDSWVAMLLASNPTMDRAQLASHPMRHVLINVLGARDHVDVQVGECALADGDLLLACSDGLHGPLGETELCALLACGGDLGGLARALVRAARDKGGPDNITALLVRCGSRS